MSMSSRNCFFSREVIPSMILTRSGREAAATASAFILKISSVFILNFPSWIVQKGATQCARVVASQNAIPNTPSRAQNEAGTWSGDCFAIFYSPNLPATSFVSRRSVKYYIILNKSSYL